MRQGKTDSQSLLAGDRAGGTLETVFNGCKLGVILAPVWKRVIVRDEWEGLARIQCLES